MTLLNKLFLQKVALVSIALFITACGGDASTKVESEASTEDLNNIAENATAQPILVAPTGATTSQINGNLFGAADVYIGTLDLPYYFDTTNALTSFWLPSLEVRETITVPLMMTLPKAGTVTPLGIVPPKPTAGWPIVMYQHGITRNRTDVLAYADAQAVAGFGMIAIDLPQHGLVDTNNPFNAVNTAFPTDIEQTFGANATSGENFINLRSLLTSRDNLRQGAANLITLRKSLGGIINAATMMPETIDTSKVGLIAHSLGGMVAIPYLASESTRTPSSIVMAGATITDVLSNSASFSPVINAGLADLGVTTPTGIALFYQNAQELVDAGEPANYAAAAANHPIHLIQVNGDQTVPNSASENLASLMGATTVTATAPGIAAAVAAGSPGVVRFTAGSHSSPLDPTSSLAATTEIQRQLSAFQFANGAAISIFDPSVIQ